MIPQSFIHDLLSRVNIIDIVERHVSLKKAGANYVACCPFHSEKTPSFTVSPTKQFYHCFGCGVHGNAISFLIEYRGLGFVDAVQELADSVGMQLPERQAVTAFTHSNLLVNAQDSETNSTQDLLATMRMTTQFYRDQLKQSEKAIDYLKKRGISGKTAARFALGYAPGGWQPLSSIFTDYKSEKTRKLLSRTGLVVADEGGSQYDRFRNRIMFPILNLKGQIIAFGGRIIDQGEPKYLNSPETDLFIKGQEVYNLFAARKAIRDSGCVLVVEGYMDVVALSEHGLDYAVATLGTAITDKHIQKLLRQSDKVVFCFDGDHAGKKAAWRALDNCLGQLTDGKSIYFLFLPEGEDPDSFVSQNGKAVFEQQIAQAQPLSEFLLQGLSRNQDLQLSEHRARLIHDAKPMLQRIKAPALMLMILNKLSQLSGLDRHELTALLQIKHHTVPEAAKKIARKQPVTPYRRLLRLFLYNPKFWHDLDVNLLSQNDGNHELSVLKALFDFLHTHPDIADNATTVTLLTYFENTPHQLALEKIAGEIIDWDDEIDMEAEFFGTIKELQAVHCRQRMQELQNKPLGQLTDEEKRELQRLAMH